MISYCNFQHKPKNKAHSGSVVVIDNDDKLIGYHIISLCSWQEIGGGGGNYGNEPLRIGSDGLINPQTSRVVIEFNVFNDTYLGDSEAISVKSR